MGLCETEPGSSADIRCIYTGLACGGGVVRDRTQVLWDGCWRKGWWLIMALPVSYTLVARNVKLTVCELWQQAGHGREGDLAGSIAGLLTASRKESS